MITSIVAKIPLAYRSFILPALVLVSILAFSLTIGRAVWEKIVQERGVVSALQTDNTKLLAKKEILASQDNKTLLIKTQAAVDAIPAEIPALPTLASLNFLATQTGVTVTDFRITERKDKKSETSYLEMVVNFEGITASSLTFLNELKNMAPLVKVIEITSTVQTETARSKVTLNSIWSPLPKELGKPNSPLETLSKADEEVANKLLQLKKSKSKVAEGSVPQGRANPFAL